MSYTDEVDHVEHLAQRADIDEERRTEIVGEALRVAESRGWKIVTDGTRHSITGWVGDRKIIRGIYEQRFQGAITYQWFEGYSLRAESTDPVECLVWASNLRAGVRPDQ